MGQLDTGKIENNFWIGNLMFKIKPTRNLTSYKNTQNNTIINFNSTSNDRKYGYYYKIVSKLDVKETYKPQEELDIQLTIRQCPPIFNVYYDINGNQIRNPWAVGELTGPGHQHGDAPYYDEIYYLPLGHPVLTRLITQVKGLSGGMDTITVLRTETSAQKIHRSLNYKHTNSPLYWNIYFTDFDFNEKSVCSYRWGLRYIHCAVHYDTHPEWTYYNNNPRLLFSHGYQYLYADGPYGVNGPNGDQSFESNYQNFIAQSDDKNQKQDAPRFWEQFFRNEDYITIPRLTGRCSVPGVNPAWQYSQRADTAPCYLQRGINANLYVMAYNKWGKTITRTLGINQLKGYIGRSGYGYQVTRFIRPAALHLYPLYLEHDKCLVKPLNEYYEQWNSEEYETFYENGNVDILVGTDGDKKLGDINYYGDK